MKDLKFTECDACSAKPGSPTLCLGCLHNRNVIERLRDFPEIHYWWTGEPRTQYQKGWRDGTEAMKDNLSINH